MSSATEERYIHNSILQLGLEAHACNPSCMQEDHKFEVCLDYIANSRSRKLSEILCKKKKLIINWVMVAHIFNLSTREVEAGGSL